MMAVRHRAIETCAHGTVTVCGRKPPAATTLDWDRVSCKACLKKRPAPVLPFADPLLSKWEQGVDPLTAEWLREHRRDVDAVAMLDTLTEDLFHIQLGPVRTAEDERRQPALMTDRESLRRIVREAIAAMGGA